MHLPPLNQICKKLWGEKWESRPHWINQKTLGTPQPRYYRAMQKEKQITNDKIPNSAYTCHKYLKPDVCYVYNLAQVVFSWGSTQSIDLKGNLGGVW